MSAKKDDDLLMNASWPGSCPAPGEQHLISIICGSTRLSWALHSQQQYYPTLFWQTTPIDTTEVPKRELYQLFPPHVRTIIFGPKIAPSAVSPSPRAKQQHMQYQLPEIQKSEVSRNIFDSKPSETSGTAGTTGANKKDTNTVEKVSEPDYKNTTEPTTTDETGSTKADEKQSEGESKTKERNETIDNKKEHNVDEKISSTLAETNEISSADGMEVEKSEDPNSSGPSKEVEDVVPNEQEKPTLTNEDSEKSASKVDDATDEKVPPKEPTEGTTTKQNEDASTQDAQITEGSSTNEKVPNDNAAESSKEQDPTNVETNIEETTLESESIQLDKIIVPDEPKSQTESDIQPFSNDKDKLTANTTSSSNDDTSAKAALVEANPLTQDSKSSDEVIEVKQIGRPRKKSRLSGVAKLVKNNDDSQLDDSEFYSSKRAVQYRSTFRIPAVSIYIVSTNEKHIIGIASIFRNIPCRIFRLAPRDFIIPETVQIPTTIPKTLPAPPTGNPVPSEAETDYSGINIDRLCILEGAKYLYAPQKSFLIIDTGNTSTMTYTATDRSGFLLGGGVGPSISTKLRAYNDYSSWSLPHIWRTTVLDLVQQRNDRSVLPQQQTSDNVRSPLVMENAVITTTLKETALSVSNIVKGWMDCIQILKSKTSLAESPSSKTRSKQQQLAVEEEKSKTTVTNTDPPMLLVTGTDAEIFKLLLQPKHSNLCDSSDHSDAIAQCIETAVVNGQMKTSYAGKNTSTLLAHHGIQYLLLQQDQVKKALKSTPKLSHIEEIRDVLLGQRVALIQRTPEETIGSYVCDLAEVPRRAKFSFGSVIHILRELDVSDDDNDVVTIDSDLERDYFSIFWDDSCLIDDVNPKELYDRLVLYTKANEADNEIDPGRKARLIEKAEDAKKASILLAQNSVKVREMIKSRLPGGSTFPSQLLPQGPIYFNPLVVSSPATGNVTTKQRNAGSAAKQQPAKYSSPSPAKTRPSKYTSAKSTQRASKTVEKRFTSVKSVPPPSSKRKKEVTSSVSSSVRKRSRAKDDYDDVIPPATKMPKKGTRATSAVKKDSNKEGNQPYLNRRVAKQFDGNIYFGMVQSFTPAKDNAEGIDLWGIEYDDGDAEDFEEDELMDGFLLYRTHQSKDKVGNLIKRDKLKSSQV